MSVAHKKQESTMDIAQTRRIVPMFSHRAREKMATFICVALCVLTTTTTSFPIHNFHHSIDLRESVSFSIGSSSFSSSSSSCLLASSSSSTSPETSDDNNRGANLLHSLNEKFQYDGRLPMKDGFRCGFVSILGAPNMGKSTLLNGVLKEDLCIATRRPQTTRHAILGVLTTSDTQLCLIDTPGIIDDPAYKLQEGMMEAVIGAFHDSDVLLVVTDLFSTPIPDDKIFQRVCRSKLPIIVVINKIDLVGKANPEAAGTSNDDDSGDGDTEEGKTYSVPQAVARWRALLPNAIAIIPVAASEGPDNEGVVVLRKLLLGGDDLPAAIRDLGRPVPGMFQPGVKFLNDEDAKRLLPQGPPLYDEELLTDRTERFFVSELIRESLFETLKKELPYCCEVRIDDFKEAKPDDKKKVNRIKASVVVERDSQKKIVIGKGGEQIKKVGVLAREKIERFLQEKVFLEITVKVNKDWRKNDEQLKQYGYLKS